MIKLTVKGFTLNGYSLDILWQNENQVLMNDAMLKDGEKGKILLISDFPEIVALEFIMEKLND